MKRFEDLVAWQRAKEFCGVIYRDINCGYDYSFRDQLRRASISIMNNIAEGFERKSNNEFRQFLYIAKGSSGEVRSMLYVALDEKYISKDMFDKLYNESLIVSKTIAALIKCL